MIRYIISVSFLFSHILLCGQTTGSLQGIVTDQKSDERLVNPILTLYQENTQIAMIMGDLDGNYLFSSVAVGKYELVVSVNTYPDKTITDIYVSEGQTKKVDIQMNQAGIIDTTFVIKDIEVYPDKIIQFGDNGGRGKRDKNFITQTPERGIGNVLGSIAGMQAPDINSPINAGGARDYSNMYYIDGVPTLTGYPVADIDVEEIQVMTSGIPAMYGNATGSFTNIITKGPSNTLRAGLQVETSYFLDNFGETTVNGSFSGPILSKVMLKDNPARDTVKRANGEIVKSTILGYRFSGSYSNYKDNRPSALPRLKLKDDKLADILANPLVSNPSGTGSVYNSDFLTAADFEESPIRSNAQSHQAQYSGKIEWKPNQDFFLVLGSEGQFNWGTTASVPNQLFNYNFNPLQKSDNLGFSIRFRHKVSSTDPSMNYSEDTTVSRKFPVFQNLSYELTGSYNMTNFATEDPRYKDRLWEYGYVGKFYESRRPVMGVMDSLPIYNSIGEVVGWNEQVGHTAFFNSFDKYEANWDINPGLAAYNNLIAQPNNINDLDNFDPNAPTSINQMEIINGLMTGGRSSAYGLFNAPHINNSGFGKSNSSQARGNAQVNFDLVTNQKSGNPMRHQIQLGGTFEQQVERSYNINPFSLWNLAYQTTNEHISNAADPTRPTGQSYFDPLTQKNYAIYESLIRTDAEGNEVQMSTFGANLRQGLGLDKRDWVSVHELTPDQMKLEWFDPSSLITGNQRVITYYGYDYLGNALGTDVQFNDFFTATDKNGIKTRPVAPFKPIYVAGYIQDKFVYKDMIFNLGVRFDSYDANTSVLKDPYSLAGYETAAEFESNGSIYAAGRSTEYQRPSNIGDDYAVYVNQNSEDAVVVGYRSGRQWYNAQGLPVNVASELGANFLPALKGFGTSYTSPQGENYKPSDAFQDYTPTLIVMPRISLSFPISDMANFYANYDILSQRPPVGGYASAYDYYNFREITANNNPINNPNLKPEQTINYEVGFQQALNLFSKIKLAVVYKEERNLIQLQQYVNAYPNTYNTFGNDDFSTTKAFKLEYETFRRKNLRILANYTLQFSEGTGSTPTSSAGVAARELKYVFALDFDQRHTFYVNIDYRFPGGDKYFGPRIKGVNIFENMGISLSINANSGRPYTQKEIPGGIGTGFQDRITEGSVNGSRTPWNFRVGLKIDRNFVIGKNSKHPLYLNIYLRVTNLFNTQNVLGVYSTTGSPTDDGFLTTAGSPGPGFAASQADSYELLYNMRMNDPYNISRPRQIFLGMNVSF